MHSIANKPPANQATSVLAYLRTRDGAGQRRGITQLEANELFDAKRLAARIEELRDLGHHIKSDRRTDYAGKRYVRYFLITP